MSVYLSLEQGKITAIAVVRAYILPNREAYHYKMAASSHFLCIFVTNLYVTNKNLNKNMFKVAIIGGSTTNDYGFFEKKCIECLRNKAKIDTIMIYSIGDEFVERFANRFNIDVSIISQHFKKYKNDTDKMKDDELFGKIDAIIIFDNFKYAKSVSQVSNEKNIPTRLIRKNGKP